MRHSEPENFSHVLQSSRLMRNALVDEWIDLARVFFVHLPLVGFAQRNLIHIPLRVVVVMAGRGIDAANGADHLRTEENVVDWNNLKKQIDAGLMIDACVEKNVIAHHLIERWALQILS